MSWLRDFAYLAALAVWTGTGIYFTFGATPAVFARFERPLTGDVVAALFPGFYRFAMVAAAIVALGAAARFAAARPYAAVALVLAVVILAANVVGGLVLHPRIHELREALRAQPAADPALEASFGRLHGLSMGVNLLSLLASVALWSLLAAGGL